MFTSLHVHSASERRLSGGAVLAAILVASLRFDHPLVPRIAEPVSRPRATSAISPRARYSGSRRFYGIQKGPTSPGRTWLLEVTNVSVTPYTYTENFTGEDAVLSRDNLKIAFRVHTVWRIDDTRIPIFMERFSTTASQGESRQGA